MSNLGLGNLIELKRRLLPATMLTQSTYDATVTQIGRGVAVSFDSFCNRHFERVAGAVDQFSADRIGWVLRRFPVEVITSIEVRDDVAAGWIAHEINSIVEGRDDEAGILKFGSTQGVHLSDVRVTYTGGYWFDIEEDLAGTQPAGSTLVPDDVKEAWFLQSAHIWDIRDKLGVSLISDPNAKSKLATLELIPEVEQILRSRIRYQIT